ncbi:MAG: hotdog fold thioesterase [Saprospiraceae bacterium]
MIWKNEPTIDGINQIMQNTLVSHLGITFTEVGSNYLKATMPVDNRTKQPMGLLHGGASVALSETVGSIAGVLILDDPSEASIVGIEISATHLKSVKSGLVTGITKPIKIGKRLQVWNTEIFDENGNIICISKLTTMRIQNDK